MTETAPILDLGAEAARGGWQIALVIALGLAALAWLARRTLLKRQRTITGEGCGDCAGCGTSGGACHVAPTNAAAPDLKSQ